MAITDRSAIALMLAVAAGGAAMTCWRADSPGTGEPPGARATVSYAMQVEGVRSSTVINGQRQGTATVEHVRVVPAAFLGPFRIGFMPALSASGVSLELAREDQADVALAALARQLSPPGGRRASIPIEIDGLQVTALRHGARQTLLSADGCAATLLSPALHCRRGQLRQGDTVQRFRSARLEGAVWRIEPGDAAGGRDARSRLSSETARVAGSGRR
jgi:hypothetical protein